MSHSGKNKAPIHVCSLSMSALKGAKERMRRMEQNYDPRHADIEEKKEFFVNKWRYLSMEYNRFSQLQFVYSHLGDKESSPQFRKVLIKPPFHAWRREILRQKWQEVRKELDIAGIDARLNMKKNVFNGQRAKLAERAITSKLNINAGPLESLIDVKGDMATLLAFQSPNSVQPGFFNEGLNFLGTDEVKSISDVDSMDSESNDDQNRDSVASKEDAQKKGSRWWW